MIGSCFSCPVGSPDSNSKPGCWFSRLGQLWQLKMFLLCKSFPSFLTSYFTWRVPSQLRPFASAHTVRSFREKTPTQLSALLEFRFLTILLIPKRKSLPQTKSLSWYLKMNGTTAHDYITFGKVRKLGLRLPLLLHEITIFFRLLYTLELCVFVPLGAVEICFCST